MSLTQIHMRVIKFLETSNVELLEIVIHNH